MRGPMKPEELRRYDLKALRRRANRLTKLDLKEVHIRDRGTDLRLKIARGARSRRALADLMRLV